MEADGWTNIEAVLLNHSNQETARGPNVGRTPLITFLTDVEPTASVMTPSVILSNI
ncbi:hypothetical protein VULLAG_LOCUS17110 [Vulpes lagopus]